jgi:hypothetical protein
VFHEGPCRSRWAAAIQTKLQVEADTQEKERNDRCDCDKRLNSHRHSQVSMYFGDRVKRIWLWSLLLVPREREYLWGRAVLGAFYELSRLKSPSREGLQRDRTGLKQISLVVISVVIVLVFWFLLILIRQGLHVLDEISLVLVG